MNLSFHDPTNRQDEDNSIKIVNVMVRDTVMIVTNQIFFYL